MLQYVMFSGLVGIFGRAEGAGPVAGRNGAGDRPEETSVRRWIWYAGDMDGEVWGGLPVVALMRWKCSRWMEKKQKRPRGAQYMLCEIHTLVRIDPATIASLP